MFQSFLIQILILIIDEFLGLNDYLKAVLDKFKVNMNEGMPSLGIPSLDPFFIPELDFPRLTGAYGPYGYHVDINMDFNNLSIAQLSTYDVTFVDVNLNQLSLDLQLKIPMLLTDGNYILDGYARDVYFNKNSKLFCFGLKNIK